MSLLSNREYAEAIVNEPSIRMKTDYDCIFIRISHMAEMAYYWLDNDFLNAVERNCAQFLQRYHTQWPTSEYRSLQNLLINVWIIRASQLP